MNAAIERAPDAPRMERGDRAIVALGWSGTLAILVAHFLENAGSTDGATLDRALLLYPLLNLYGAVALVVLCVRRRVWQSVALNSVWGLIAAVALVGALARL